jgi:hypothetical protein
VEEFKYFPMELRGALAPRATVVPDSPPPPTRKGVPEVRVGKGAEPDVLVPEEPAPKVDDTPPMGRIVTAAFAPPTTQTAVSREQTATAENNPRLQNNDNNNFFIFIFYLGLLSANCAAGNVLSAD